MCTPTCFFKGLKRGLKKPFQVLKKPFQALKKPFRGLFSGRPGPKEEDKCLGLPKIQITCVEEDSLSLTGSESDSSPARGELDPGPISDSLEGIPEMLEAETSWMNIDNKPCLLEAGFQPVHRSDSLMTIPDLSPQDSLTSFLDADKNCPAEVEFNAGHSSESFPEPQVTYSEEDICEPFVEENIVSVTYADNNSSAEAKLKLGQSSESLPESQMSYSEEDMPEKFVAENILSVTVCEDVQEAPFGAAQGEREEEEMNDEEGSVNSWDLDSDSCDGESSSQEFHLEDLDTVKTKEDLHRLCVRFSHLPLEERIRVAEKVASGHLNLMVEHYVESSEKVCDELMNAVFGLI